MHKTKYHIDFDQLREILSPGKDNHGNKLGLPSEACLLEMHKHERSYFHECNYHIISLFKVYCTLSVMLISAIGYLWLNYGTRRLDLIVYALIVGIIVCTQWLLDRKNIQEEGAVSRIICSVFEAKLNCRITHAEKHVLNLMDDQATRTVKLLRLLDKYFDFPLFLIVIFSLLMAGIITRYIIIAISHCIP